MLAKNYDELIRRHARFVTWRRTWAQHYPRIDFNARVGGWRERWRQELIPVAHVDDVISQALARKPIAIEWEEPPDPPVAAPAAQPAASTLAH